MGIRLTPSKVIASIATCAVVAAILAFYYVDNASGQIPQAAGPNTATEKKSSPPPYYVSVALDNTFTQEFRVQSDNNVSSTSKVGNTNWLIEFDSHQSADKSILVSLQVGKFVSDDSSGNTRIHHDSFSRFKRLKLDEEPQSIPVPMPFVSSWQIKKVTVAVSSKSSLTTAPTIQ